MREPKGGRFGYQEFNEEKDDTLLGDDPIKIDKQQE
jgi:hypothetical protein